MFKQIKKCLVETELPPVSSWAISNFTGYSFFSFKTRRQEDNERKKSFVRFVLPRERTTGRQACKTILVQYYISGGICNQSVFLLYPLRTRGMVFWILSNIYLHHMPGTGSSKKYWDAVHYEAVVFKALEEYIYNYFNIGNYL